MPSPVPFAKRLALFQAAQVRRKERKQKRKKARLLEYNRVWQWRYRRRLKREAREEERAELRYVLAAARELLIK
jgi:hypothetical protein